MNHLRVIKAYFNVVTINFDHIHLFYNLASSSCSLLLMSHFTFLYIVYSLTNYFCIRCTVCHHCIE
jgi:hypothetical protein